MDRQESERLRCRPGGQLSGRAHPVTAIPSAELMEKRPTALVAGQQEDDGWPDPHGLLQWRPLHTLWALRDRGLWQRGA